MNYRFRDLLAIEPLSAAEIAFILDQSKPFQEIQRNPLKKLATLRGKTVVLAFFENSTRTRLSFGTAASRLGADTMNLQAEASSLKKGETLLDTANNLNAMKPDCFVMRHSSSGAADFVARHLEIPVVNAGDGTHEHPSQGLLAGEWRTEDGPPRRYYTLSPAGARHYRGLRASWSTLATTVNRLIADKKGDASR